MTSVSENGDGRITQKHAPERSGFFSILQRCPPPLPPSFFRKLDYKDSGVGKVKVMLRISNPSTLDSSASERHNSFLSLDKRKKQIILTDPSLVNGATPEERRVGVVSPKMFTFDAIFSPDDSQTEICSSVLIDVIRTVMNGTDSCLFSFGQAGLGKSYTMLGSPETTSTIGIIPCAISWLFKSINEQKQKTGARFSVRVSAVEIGGPTNQLKDLLMGFTNDSEQSPGVLLQDDHGYSNQSPPHCELRVPSAEKAAFYLDAALEGRTCFKEEMRDSHFLYTLHIYQYSVADKGGVAGGRSRLHLIDLGNSDRIRVCGDISVSSVGNIIDALLNGQKFLPYKDHKLTQLLKECLGPVTCHATMIAHISPFVQNYADTLSTVQLASRIHRIRRRKFKFPTANFGNSSGGSSGEDASRAGTGSEPDPSSSDLSADTVIYVGRAEEATDGEHPPVYIPSLNSGDNRCSISKALKGSIAEHKITQTSKSSKTSDKTNRSVKSSHSHKLSDHCSSRSSGKKEPSRSRTDSPKYFFDRSDEQWIDGPRISKTRIAEAFQMMKEKYRVKKCETWVDGPLQEDSNQDYGYMDSHKKNMIKKWVEHQSVQIHKTKPAVSKIAKVVSQKNYVKAATFLKCNDDVDLQTVENKKYKVLEKPAKTKGTTTDEDNEEEEEPELPPALPLIQPLSSREVSIESLDQILRERMISTAEYDYQEKRPFESNTNDNEELEIIEVEEPLEPVPMFDKCLQVTEEDIRLCMGNIEDPLPEVDQQSTLESCLNFLSEENLSATSSFSDSASVFNDLQGILPRFLDINCFYHDYEDIDNHSDQNYIGDDSYIKKLNESVLHNCYCSNIGNSGLNSLKNNQLHNSMTLSEFLFDHKKQKQDDCSIYSEPIYLQERFCENCRASLKQSNSAFQEYAPFFSISHINEAGLYDTSSIFERYNHKQKDLSELRQPDGASNPNLKEGSDRSPGSGACASNFLSEVTTTPPLLTRNPYLLARNNRRSMNFETGIAAIKLKHKSRNFRKTEDSSKEPAVKTSNSGRVESGYASTVGTNELPSSNFGPSEISISHSRSKCKHNHSKSFCSWFLNPFTCKYVDEARETHL